MRTRWFLLLIATVLVLAACGGDDDSSTSEADVQALTGVDETFAEV